MGLFDFFKKSPVKKGANIAQFIVSQLNNDNFLELISSIPEPMKSRLFLDNIMVSTAAAICSLNLAMLSQTNKRRDTYIKIMDSMISKLSEIIQNMDFDVQVNDIVINKSERKLFLREGWTLEERTSIYTVFSMLGDDRMEKYNNLIAKGFSESMETSDGARLTAHLMQESMKNCGEENYPYVQLKLIYTVNITQIFKLCHSI